MAKGSYYQGGATTYTATSDPTLTAPAPAPPVAAPASFYKGGGLQYAGNTTLVTSWKGRVGAVLPATNDYSFSDISGLVGATQLNYTLSPTWTGQHTFVGSKPHITVGSDGPLNGTTGGQIRFKDGVGNNANIDFSGGGFQFANPIVLAVGAQLYANGGLTTGGTVTLNGTVGIGSAFTMQGASSFGDIAFLPNAGNVQGVQLFNSASTFYARLTATPSASYNFNLPTTVGTAGQVLTSQAGGATAMTWSSLQNIAGAVTAAQLPTPTLSTLGGVKAISAVAHQWVASIDTTGTPQLSQPAFGDISGSIASGQLPAGAITTSLGYTPVQQGTGIGQLISNVVKIGWTGSVLKATVDVTDEGAFLTSGNIPAVSGGGTTNVLRADGTWTNIVNQWVIAPSAGIALLGLDTGAPGQSLVSFRSAGTELWQIGKDNDQSFFIWDTAASKIVLRIGPNAPATFFTPFGYGTGAGGAITQLTSRTTGVTLNKTCGAITLFAAAPVVNTAVSFTVTNSTVAATDNVVVSVASSNAANTYVAHVSAVAAGSFRITFWSAVGTTSDSPVINFAVIKAVNA